MKKLILKWIEARKLKQERARGNEIRSQFQIRERDGYIWILCNGVAIHKADSQMQANEVSSLLYRIRHTAIEYEMN